MRISGLNSYLNFMSFANIMLCGVVLSIQSWQLQHHALGSTSLGSTLQRSGSLNSTCVQCIHNGIASSSFCSGPNASHAHSNISSHAPITHSNIPKGVAGAVKFLL